MNSTESRKETDSESVSLTPFIRTEWSFQSVEAWFVLSYNALDLTGI